MALLSCHAAWRLLLVQWISDWQSRSQQLSKVIRQGHQSWSRVAAEFEGKGDWEWEWVGNTVKNDATANIGMGAAKRHSV